MRRSVLVLFAALATMSFGLCSTSVWAQAPKPDSGPSPSQADGRTFHRPVTHMLGLASEQPWRVGAMKMLAPGIGWVLAAGGRLLWTENGGADWKNFKPHFAGNENIGKIFFLDRSRGWVANSLYEPDSDELQLTLASTTEGGANWSQVASTLRLKDYGISPGDAAGGGVGALAFTDALHGWLYMEFGGQTMNTQWSFFLMTSDGGRTWKQARNAPAVADASMRLAPLTDGWLLGSDHEDPYEQLYVTRDQARSWKHVSVRAPKEVLSLTETNYELPTFLNKSHGYLPVNYSYYDGTNDTVSQVLFATDDGGRTWKPDRIVKNMEDQSSSSTVVDSKWVFVRLLKHHPILKTVGAGEKIDFGADASPNGLRYHAASDTSFVTPTEGWVVVGDGDLLSTTDGGATWTDITPGPKW